MNATRKIAANMTQSGNKVTIRFFIDGKQFAFHTTQQGLTDLLTTEGEYIGRLEF